ncbi:MAG: hypothetical protein ABR606_15665 [Vicinamibacterales bacterium]
MSELKALPIACTLSPGDLRERLGLIQTLTQEALRAHERQGLDLTLHYAPEAAARVRAMVAGEQHCCAFLTFDIGDDAQACTSRFTRRSMPAMLQMNCLHSLPLHPM